MKNADIDHFRGAEQLLRLSQRLMDWYEKPVTDEEVGEVLGADLVPAFRYAQKALEGRVRRVTLEPAFCHSADIAVRALGLAYPPLCLKACLLHDVIEDTSKSLADVHRAMADLSEHFSSSVAQTVSLLTNHYQIIFKNLALKVRADLPFKPRTVRAFRAALDLIRYETPSPVVDRCALEFDRLATFLETDVNLKDGARIVHRDKKFQVATHLERQVYNLYLQDLVEKAAEDADRENSSESVTALVVKLLDVTDNIRTSEISNRLTLFKLTNKAEAFLDEIQVGFIDKVGTDVTTIPDLHRLVQLRLVDQLEARRRAIANNFSETRFGGLVDFLSQQTARLANKYSVTDERVTEIREIEDRIQRANRY